MTGDAERLPFEDNSFDAVVNVESSHCYGSMDAFLNQVKRVLRRGGHFLYADLRGRESVGGLLKQLRHSGMRLVREANITSNVARALTLDDERKKALIREMRHRILSRLYCQFAGVKGSKVYEGFRSGQLTYLSFIMQKH
jgi:ubiquinone/menaquinone biosynthesis C-methylase UbiE